MNDEIWQRAKDVFGEVLALPRGERGAFLETRCAGDATLRAEVDSLLSHHEKARSFLAPPEGPGLLRAKALPGDLLRTRRTAERLLAGLRRGPAAGAVVAGRYELGQRLGSGSFGTVYRARDRLASRAVAVKVFTLLPGPVPSAFRREVAMLRRVRLAGVADLLDDGFDEGLPFLVMDLVDGEPFPGTSGPVSWPDVAPATRALLEALARLHGLGVIHRDLKPANVLVDRRGTPTIVDLGVAWDRRALPRLGRSMAFAGTPAYLAPELFFGRTPDERSDLYALGVMLYETLTRRPPHPAATVTELCEQRRRGREIPLSEAVPGIPAEVSDAVASLLAPLAENRPASAREALDRIFSPGRKTPAWARSSDPAAEQVHALIAEALRGPPDARTLTRQALEGLFAGPDRIHHLRADAAEELESRAGGDPAAVARELASWVRSGLARVEGGRLVIERPALGRLRVESEAQSALRPDAGPAAGRPARLRRRASSLRPGDPARLFLLAAAGADAEIPREAVALARRLLDEGRIGEAMGVVEEGLSALRREGGGDVEAEEDLLAHFLQAALWDGTVAALDRALYHAGRAGERTARGEAVEGICRGALLAVQGDARRAEETLVAVRVPPADPLERWRQTVRVTAGRYGEEAQERRAIADAVRWVRDLGGTEPRALLRSWIGWFRYRQGRYRDAARLNLEAARAGGTPVGRLNALLQAASASMEAGDMDGAGTLASEARAEAARLRHAFYEARAEWILRSAAYRSGREGEPDLELVEAVRDLRQPNVEAMVCLNEAAIAWRLGDRATASRLADAASVSWNSTGRWWFSLLARSLSIRARGAAQPGEVSAILARIPACRLPGVVLQVFGLVAPLGIAGESVSVGLAEEAAASLRGRDPGLRREVLSVQEALDFVRGGSAS